MIEIIFLTIKIIVILSFVGYGFTVLFIPKNLREDAIWFCPWLGTILIAVLGVILSLGKVPMAQGSNLILILSAILFLYAFVAGKLLPISSRTNVILAISVCFILFFNLYPLLTRVGFPTTISLGNLDPLSYTPVGDFLVKHTVFEGGNFEHYKPYLWATGDLIHHGFRWGSPLILSFFASILGLKSYQIFSVLISIYFALSFPLVFILAKKIYSKNNFLLMFLTFLTFALNSTLLYMLYNVFYAQFIFTGILILIVILAYSYFGSDQKGFSFNSFDFLIALALSSITTIYPEGLPFVVLPFLVFVALSFFTKNRFLNLISFGKIVFLALIINPVTAGTTIGQNLKIISSSTQTVFIGWEKIRQATPLEMTGFYNLYFYKDLPSILDFLFGLLVVAIWFYGFLKVKNKLFILSLLIAFLPFYIGLLWIFPNFFSYHRVITYSLFLYAVLFAGGVVHLLYLMEDKVRQFIPSPFFLISKRKIFTLLILIIFLVFTIRSAHRTLFQMYWHHRAVDKSLISLTKLNENSKIDQPFFTSDVYLGEYDIWKRLWREYFLVDKEIVTRQNYTTEKDYLDDVKLVLVEKNYLERYEQKLVYKNIVWQNEYYQLGEIEPIDVAEDLR